MKGSSYEWYARIAAAVSRQSRAAASITSTLPVDRAHEHGA